MSRPGASHVGCAGLGRPRRPLHASVVARARGIDPGPGGGEPTPEEGQGSGGTRGSAQQCEASCFPGPGTVLTGRG